MISLKEVFAKLRLSQIVCKVILELKINIMFFKLYLFSMGPIGTSIKTLTGKVEKTVSNHRSMNKPVGGLNVAEAFIKKAQKEDLKVISLLLAKHIQIHLLMNIP